MNVTSTGSQSTATIQQLLSNAENHTNPVKMQNISGGSEAHQRIDILKLRQTLNEPDLDIDLYDKDGNYVFQTSSEEATDNLQISPISDDNDKTADQTQALDSSKSSKEYISTGTMDTGFLNADLPVDDKNIQNFLKANGVDLPAGVKLNIQILSSDPSTGYQFKVTGSGDPRFDAMFTSELNQSPLIAGDSIVDALHLFNQGTQAEEEKIDAEIFVQRYGGDGASLNTLSMKNGQIVGASSELQNMVDAKTPDDMVKAMYPAGTELTPQQSQMLYDGIQNDLNMLKNVLSVGPSNIPDLTGFLTYSNGKLEASTTNLDVSV